MLMLPHINQSSSNQEDISKVTLKMMITISASIQELGSVGMVSLLFTILAILMGYFYWPSWTVRRIPGPLPFPVLGHLPLLAKHGPNLFSLLAKQYGPIFRFHMGRQPIIIVADAELCKEVGIKKFKDIPNRSMPSPVAASPLHQKGLFFTKDARWAKMRNTVLSVYQPSHLASLIPTMQTLIESGTEKFKSVDEDEDVIFSNISLQLATDVLGKAAFGVDFGLSKQSKDCEDKQVSEFVNKHIYSTTQLKMDLSGSFSIIVGLLVPIFQEPIRQILKRIPGTMDYKLERTNKSLSARLDDIVDARMKSNNLSAKDFLSLILNERNSEMETRKLFSPDIVSAVTYEHLLAGSATTSFTLSSVIYLISDHPEVEKKVLAEISSFPHNQIPTAHDLQHKFPYIDQVIKESMRFYVISPLISRETSRDVQLGGYHLPKGTWVWLAPEVLAKDPQHFPDPEKFKPERFDPNGEEEKGRHPYAHIPFGLGPRSCIGQKFSLQEIKLAVIHLYRNYLFCHSPNLEKPLEFQYGIVLNFKQPLKLRVVKRSKCV